ncbi:MAG: glycoside hydrolase family 105 protein [Mycoplasmatales bacterium]
MNENLLKNIELVANKLLDLQDFEDAGFEYKGKDDQAIGLYPRDFGMGFWDWPQGVGLYGLYKFDNEQNQKKYEEYIKNWYESFKQNEVIKNVNTCAPMLTIAKLVEANPEYEAIVKEWAHWVMYELPRANEGTIQHVTSNFAGDGIRLNEGEVWIDTIFMTVLFLNQVGLKTNNHEMSAEADFQILQHIKLLFNNQDHLFYHGYTFNENNNFGNIYWCRGNSWFTVAMVEYLEQLPKEKVVMKRFILNALTNQVEKLFTLQHASGLWHTVLDDDTSYLETSGSAAILAGVLKGIRLGYIDQKYLENAKKGIEALIDNIDETGVVQNVSGGTGIGMDKDHYKNIVIGPMAYGQSLTLIALTEALNHF